MRNRIVVGVDESEGAGEALRWAYREAALHHVDLVAVIVWGFLNQHTDALAGFNPDYDDAAADAALEQIIRARLGDEAVRSVQRHTVCDFPGGGLLDAACGSAMLVTGARGLGGFRGLLLGSVSQHCVHHAAVPTVVVRHLDEGPRPAGVVVGIDGSDDAAEALAWAVCEARARGTRLTVVHGYQVPLVGAYPYSSITIDPAHMPRAARHVLDTALEHVDTTDLDVVPVTGPGGGARAVLECADEAELLVVGSRGLGRLQRALLGSVATQIVHHAPCPVAVIPSAQHVAAAKRA